MPVSTDQCARLSRALEGPLRFIRLGPMAHCLIVYSHSLDAWVASEKKGDWAVNWSPMHSEIAGNVLVVVSKWSQRSVSTDADKGRDKSLPTEEFAPWGAVPISA